MRAMTSMTSMTSMPRTTPARASPASARTNARASPSACAHRRRGDDDDVDADAGDVVAARAAFVSRRSAMTRALAACAVASGVDARDARADYGDTLYMQGLQGQGKDYGKSTIIYPDFTQTSSGLQYKDVVEAPAGAATYEGAKSGTAVIDWDGYTIGYYGRPFEARNKSKGGAFTGEDKDFFRFTPNDENVIGAFREAIVGMKVGSIRRIIVPPNNTLGYPDGKKWRTKKPQPANFSGDRALGFVLENQGMIDKTLLFDIELIKIQ